MRYDGVVLAGGAAKRLGGAEKPELMVGGRRLLDIAVEALSGAETTMAVGTAIPTTRPVGWVREQPPGGGPVAALAAALPMLTAPTVVALAAECAGTAAVLAVDADGRDQPLLAGYPLAALRAVLPAEPHGVSLRAVVSALEAAGPVRRVDLGGTPPVSWDCDTDADLQRARELA